MKKPAVLMIALALLTSVLGQQRGFGYDQMLERHDGDNDGVVAKDEFRGNPRLFERFDADEDGRVTREEFDAAVKRMAKNRRPNVKPRTLPAPEGVTVHRDVEYAVEDGESLKLDIYLPAATNTAPPLLVWIHGGGWKSGDKNNVNPAVLRLSAEGYAVASVNYRLKDLTIHPKNIHDCKGAVRWLRANAANYGYDPERVAVGGGSAGGHLALLLGLSAGFDELEGTVGGNTNEHSAVKAIVDFYGPSELVVFSENDARFNNAHEYVKEQLTHASPLTYLSKDDPPVIIFHGDQDKTVPLSQSQLVHARYQAAGLASELHVLEGAGHGGKVFGDDERQRLIKAFLDANL